jgi:hypothetical protein
MGSGPSSAFDLASGVEDAAVVGAGPVILGIARGLVLGVPVGVG